VTAPQPNPSPTDPRPFVALAVAALVGVALALRFEALWWLLGAVVLYALGRAFVLVLAARQAGRDPDEPPRE
jgi:hypothetical protein